MNAITILGAGAFGSALAVTISQKAPVRIWGRGLMGRESPRLPGITFGDRVSVCQRFPTIAPRSTVLLALPMQALAEFLVQYRAGFADARLVACCKGIDLATGIGPTEIIARTCPDAVPAILTGPSFAADIARALPTALTLGCADAALADQLRDELSTPTLRLYSTTDVVGAELGGALKNVIAIAAGVAIGAGLGDSARAAVMTRGYSEMMRLAVHLGAKPETLAGLSGFGDLVLTCTSEQSRNFRHGLALGRQTLPESGVTVEGVATAQAVDHLARKIGVDLPVSSMVAALTTHAIGLQDAIRTLLSRPLKPE